MFLFFVIFHLSFISFRQNEDGNKLECTTGDTQRCLNKDETHETNQELLGMRNIFRRIVVKTGKVTKLMKTSILNTMN